MTISIIGAGNVGLALAKAFITKGETVVFGVKNAAKYQSAIQALGKQAALTSVENAVAASDVVILAVPYAAALEVAAAIPDWQNKVLVDASNPIAPGFAGLSVGTNSSAAEQIAQRAHHARVVKAFNITGAENMVDSFYAAGSVFMPICSDDAAARQQVMVLAKLIGFDAVDCGELAVARYLEPMAMVWINLAIKQGLGRNFAFSLVKR